MVGRLGVCRPARVTWRDEAAPWPWRLETDRPHVSDHSVGVHVTGPNEAELVVVLLRGGWADVDYVAGGGDFGPIPAFDLASAWVFAAALDTWVIRVSGIDEQR